MSNITLDRRASLAESAYQKLAVRECEVLLMPQITPTLRMLAKVLRKAGRPSDPMFYLNASDDPIALEIRQLYYGMPLNQAHAAPIEAFCLAAKVSPLRVIEIITAIAVRLSVQSSAIIAAVTHPSIVEKTVEIALTDDGQADRATLHRATGFLPTPKSAQTHISITQNATAAAAAATIAAPAAAPPPESTIQRLTNRFNESRALPESSAVPIPQASVIDVPQAELVDAEFDNDEDDKD